MTGTELIHQLYPANAFDNDGILREGYYCYGKEASLLQRIVRFVKSLFQ